MTTSMLITIIAETIGVRAELVTDELSMRDAEAWDSLKHMELVTRLETDCQTQFTFDELVAMQVVGEIKRVLRERGLLA